MHLPVMHALQSFMPEHSPSFLVEGISSGFHNDVPSLRCFPLNNKPDGFIDLKTIDDAKDQFFSSCSRTTWRCFLRVEATKAGGGFERVWRQNRCFLPERFVAFQ